MFVSIPTCVVSGLQTVTCIRMVTTVLITTTVEPRSIVLHLGGAERVSGHLQASEQ